MALWSSSDAAEATGGTPHGKAWTANGVSIDTRTLKPGDLFVALKDIRDGHEFVADALAKGAAAALVSYVPDGLASDAPLLVVNDVLVGLECLGRAARARTDARVIGVTGSAGKTSTKEMLLTALSGQGATHASVASYNNHWGVPLTLARMPAATDFAIIEMGMSNPGEIAPLSKMARPHVAMITTIAAAHLEAFDNIEGIASEKADILVGLEPGGVAILPGDLPTSPILIAAAEAKADTVTLFGAGESCNVRLLRSHIENGRTFADVVLAGTPRNFSLGAIGDHFARNALAVVAAATAAGADLQTTLDALAKWSAPGGRGAQDVVSLPDGGQLALIDDAFNANPASVDAALQVLSVTDPASPDGAKVVVLGDMLELGPTEMDLHRAIAHHAAMSGIAKVHCVGPRMRALWDVLPEGQRGKWAEKAEDLVPEAASLASAGDVLLIKGSKSSRVSLIVDAIRKLGHPPAEL